MTVTTSKNGNSIGDKTRRYRELLDQIIVEVTDASIEEHEEPFRNWLYKNHVILQDIEKLRNDSNERSKISAFLLETQFIEFKLIDLLRELQILISTDPRIVSIGGQKRSEDLYKLTLGMLYEELYKYKADFLEKLKPLIKELNERRIRFTHYLFTSIKGIDEVVEDAKEGLAHNDKVFEELYSLFEYIKHYTWYGKMYERKRVRI